MRPRPRPALAALAVVVTVVVVAVVVAPAAAQDATQDASPPPAERIPRGTFLDDRPALVDPTARYTLYVPASGAADALRPLLLVFDPRGRARMAAELFREAAERYGWILVSSNDTRSDTATGAGNQKALDALLPEIGRFPVDRRRVYVAGFSGGAMLGWMLGQALPGTLAGVIGVGGRLPEGVSSEDPTFAHWAAAGAWDFNYDETRRLDDALARQDLPHWLEVFPGPHQWLSPELATQAVGWMELVAMRRELRPVDPALVESLWAELAAGARASEAAGDLLAARRRWEQMTESFAGLRDVAGARAEAERLADDRRAKALLREERKWDALDERFTREKLPLLRLAAGEEPLTASELSIRLGVRGLLRQAAGAGYPAAVARRMLGRVHVQASFYMPATYLDRGLDAAARTLLELALEIDDTTPHVWYNLACARARLGAVDAAFEALAKAVDLGLRDPTLLATDPDLDKLRDDPRFAALRARPIEP